MNKRILVAGGAGFIGSHLVKALIKQNNIVVSIDNYITGNNSFDGAVRNYYGDITDKEFMGWVREREPKFDEVYHLASIASPKYYIQYPFKTIKANTEGTYNLLGLARRGKFLFASTSEIYGDPERAVQSEDYNGNVSCLGDRAPYDESKRLGETITYTYYHCHNTDAKIVRIFNTYGPHMAIDDGRVIPAFIKAALTNQPINIFGDGDQTRSFCYVSDMVDGLINMMESEEHGPINLGNPFEYYSMSCLLNIIKSLIPDCKSEIQYVKGFTDTDPRIRRPDIRLAMEKLKWKPNVTLRDGLQKTIDWVKTQL